MRIFEFHFNPPAKNEMPDRLFDSFCYEPKNVYEKRLGNLYMVGEIFNVLPQNLQLLYKISQIIKEGYYNLTIQTPEKSFQGVLKAANEFLEKEIAKNNVSWLGNLNLTVLSLVSNDLGETFTLNLSKVGNAKIFSERKGKMTNLGKNLDLEGIEPYPLKVFTNIVTGRIGQGDKIAVLTSGLFDFFSVPSFSEKKDGSKESLLDELLKAELGKEKQVRELIQKGGEEVSGINGILLLIDSTKKLPSSRKVLTFKKELEKFSFKEVFTPLSKILVSFLSFLRNLLWRISEKIRFRLPQLKTKSESSPKKEKRTSPLLPLKERFREMPGLKRNFGTIALLILILVGGFFIFQKQEEKEFKAREEILFQIQEGVKEAKQFKIIGDEKKAFNLLKKYWEKISPLAKAEWRGQERVKTLQASIEDELGVLSKLEVIENPETFFEFDPKVFIPQRVIYFEENVYIFSPIAKTLFKLKTKDKELNDFTFKESITASSAAIFGDSIIFFAKPGKIVPFRSGKEGPNFGDISLLQTPFPDSNLISFTSYQRSIYFLEEKSGEIIKYPFPFGVGEAWLKPEIKSIRGARSIAIDSSIWVLKENNIISQYEKGEYRGDLNFDLFPFPKKIQKIFTFLESPYFYLMEPSQNRLVVLRKNGEVVKQFQSNQFDNLKDFAVTRDSKTIYLLNGQKIYRLSM